MANNSILFSLCKNISVINTEKQQRQLISELDLDAFQVLASFFIPPKIE